MGVKPQASGLVLISYTDGTQKKYDGVCNVSISSDWAFMRFLDGGRIQIPASMIKEMYEDSEVFIKGMKEGK